MKTIWWYVKNIWRLRSRHQLEESWTRKYMAAKTALGLEDIEDTREFMRQVKLGKGYPVAIVLALIVDADKHNDHVKAITLKGEDPNPVQPGFKVPIHTMVNDRKVLINVSGRESKPENVKVIRWRDLLAVMDAQKLWAIPKRVFALNCPPSSRVVRAYDIEDKDLYGLDQRIVI